jgi:hypothetical protein
MERLYVGVDIQYLVSATVFSYPVSCLVFVPSIVLQSLINRFLIVKGNSTVALIIEFGEELGTRFLLGRFDLQVLIGLVMIVIFTETSLSPISFFRTR